MLWNNSRVIFCDEVPVPVPVPECQCSVYTVLISRLYFSLPCLKTSRWGCICGRTDRRTAGCVSALDCYYMQEAVSLCRIYCTMVFEISLFRDEIECCIHLSLIRISIFEPSRDIYPKLNSSLLNVYTPETRDTSPCVCQEKLPGFLT